jgi:autotransporter-associated beta strand protein
MKTNRNNTKDNCLHKFILPCASLIFSILANNAQASAPSLFWDNNGLSTPSDGTWDTSTPNWAPTNTLTATPGVFVNGSFAVFAAGSGNIPVLNINMADNTVVCAGIYAGNSTAATVTTVNFSGAGSIGIAAGLQGLICDSGGSLNFNVPLTGTGGIEPQLGIVTLNGVNTFTGGSIIAAGSQLIIGGSGSLGSGSFATNITNLGALIFDTTAAQTLSGSISGSGGVLTNEGSGILTLTATNSYTGATAIGSGATLVLGPTGVLGASGSYAGAIINNGTFVFSNDTLTAESLTGVISGSGTLTAVNCAAANGTTAPAGQLSLLPTGGNTYTGITAITNGYILINSDGGLGAAPATLVPNQLTLNMPLDGHIYRLRLQTHSITLAATRGVYVGATGSGVVGGAMNVQSGNTLTVAGPISGPGSFSAGCNGSFGFGTIVLNNPGSTYAGSTYIAAGALQLGVGGALPSGTPLILYTPSGSAATFNMNSVNQTIGPLQTATSLGGGGTQTPVIKLTGALTVLQTNVSTTFAGVISGAGGSLTLNTAAGGTPGTLTLTGVNTYTGPTTISGATLALSSSGSINSTPNIAIAAGGTLDVSALTSTTFNLSASTTLSAAGTGTSLGSTAAAINGASGGVVSLGAQAIALTFAPGSFTGDSTHPALFIAQGTLNLNGNVISVNNAGPSPLGAGVYVLIQAPAITGTVAASATVTGNGIAAGTSASISISGANVILTVSSSSAYSRPTITSFSMTGTTLNLSATNGTPSGPFVLLESTNLDQPNLWKPVLTNSFDSSGNATLATNIVNTNIRAAFYIIQNP